MSADAWRVCPKCKETAEAAVERQRTALAEQYGKIPASEFIDRNAALDNVAEVEDQTFREDYEIFMDDTGRFYVGYNGRCSKCGFSHSFKVDEQVALS